MQTIWLRIICPPLRDAWAATLSWISWYQVRRRHFLAERYKYFFRFQHCSWQHHCYVEFILERHDFLESWSLRTFKNCTLGRGLCAVILSCMSGKRFNTRSSSVGWIWRNKSHGWCIPLKSFYTKMITISKLSREDMGLLSLWRPKATLFEVWCMCYFSP